VYIKLIAFFKIAEWYLIAWMVTYLFTR